MRNLFIGLAVVALLGTTSCKKYHTCECTVTVLGSTSTSSGVDDVKRTRKDAKERCESSNGSNVDCKLK